VANVDVVARRVLAEFEEMPGMALTVRQASRLFGLEEKVCRRVLDALIDMAYLREIRAGVITLGSRVAA
jgi:hypothetical protein